ncbi:hypothetical protein A2841_00220 [Candidatus Kaiserbacteria bacterium RIFCSPHIGHO2_01_FULL_48_10]|uniref:NADH-quinone oxidoreductase subunit N n=1 Tax=Candidatus Kaiserbacteria bacterium RIFCSPHIGHO2_01_FULL_48_10 TaxID=1798476 RepID=A0A1F6C5Q0_9BACT|nr:MAG: hypothetical protein A2841_00220 [Candidatus Kaiserbacteria bacterium RIFCSPHIGHO2_01_FULL_48_10]
MLAFVPEFLLVLTAIAIIFGKEFFRKDNWVPIATLWALGVAFLLRVMTFGQVKALGGLFVLNSFGWYFDLIYLGVAVAAVIFSFSVTKDRSTFFSLLLIGVVGMMLLTKSRDFLALFLSVELVALSLYSLVAFGKDEKKLEGGVKFFVLNIFASSLLIFGIGIIFAAAGSTQFAGAREAFLGNELPVFVGIVFFLAGLGFKMGIFPFNFWIPDVYQAAPVGITTLLAGASKKAAFGASVLVFLLALSAFAPFWAGLFALLAVATLLFGHLGALWQSNFRRFMAYSIIGQSGFLMMGLAAPSALGLTGLLFHVLTHAVAVIGIFAIIAFLESRGVFEIHGLDGLGLRSPFLAASLVIFFASLAGIPLFAGFVSKFILFSAAIQAGQGMLAIFAIFASAISVFFYFKIARSMFVNKPSSKPLDVPMSTKCLVTISVFLILLFGLYPGPIVGFLQKAVSVL